MAETKKKKKKESRAIASFIFELGHLKLVKRSGWWLAGITNAESVAEHSFRTAAIGYILAVMENADKDAVLKKCLFHDITEARINDQHKVAQKYLKKDESRAFDDIIKELPAELKKEIKDYKEGREKTKEDVIAKDADLLECAFQAKYYYDIGYKACADWIKNVESILATKSAKKLLKEMKKTGFDEWWQGQKLIKRG